MMAGCTGGGIGATLVFGWPLSDWAAVLLLLVISVLTIALLGALVGVAVSWFRRPDPATSTLPERSPKEPTK